MCVIRESTKKPKKTCENAIMYKYVNSGLTILVFIKIKLREICQLKVMIWIIMIFCWFQIHEKFL